MTQTSGSAANAEKPFFRYDLQTEAIEDGGQRFVEVTDPNGGKRYRFYEVEYAVACGMDGERDLEALVVWAKSELDLKTTTTELGAIVSKLGELQYLDSTAAPVAAAPVVAAPVAAAPVAAAPVVAASSPGIDVELGTSGKSPLREERSAPHTVEADFELGVAGASDTPRAAKPANDGMVLGSAGNEDSAATESAPVTDEISGPSKEVSTDLSQTFRIDKDEVQAAVRASKVMSAVEIPKDIEDELAAARDRKEAEPDSVQAPEAVPEAVPLVAGISESIANEAAESESAGESAIVLPEEPAKVAAVAEAANANEAPKRRNSASMVLWVLLLLSVAGGAGYLYMEYVRAQPDEVGPKVTPQERAAKRVPVTPPKPAAPTAALKLVEAPTEDVMAGRDGQVSWVVEANTKVVKGDELVRLVGHERLDKTIIRHTKSLVSYETQLKTAKARNRSKVASIESNVARKKLDLQLANEKRDAYIVRAPIDGLVLPTAKKADRITAADVVASVTGDASASVEFALPAGLHLVAEQELTVVSKDDAELTATCTVMETAGFKATLSCPTDSGLANGANLELKLPGKDAVKDAAVKDAAPEAPAKEATGDDAAAEAANDAAP